MTGMPLFHQSEQLIGALIPPTLPRQRPPPMPQVELTFLRECDLGDAEQHEKLGVSGHGAPTCRGISGQLGAHR